MAKKKNNINRIFNGRDYYYAYRMPPDIFGKRKRLYAKTEEELLAKIEKYEQEKDEILRAYKPGAKKLADYIVYYFRHAVECFTNTKIDLKKRLFERTILNSKLNKDIDELTTEEINDYYRELSEKYTSANIKQINELIQNACTLAVKDGISCVVDFSQIIFPDDTIKRNKKDYILSPEEFDILLNYCINDTDSKNHKNTFIIIVIMLTGLPLSSVTNLRYRDVDLKRGVLSLEDREYCLTDEAKTWFTEFFKENDGSGDDYLFASSSGARTTKQVAAFAIKSFAKKCGLPDVINARTLQKSYIVYEINKGTPRKVLQQRLGYKKLCSITIVLKEYEFSRYDPASLN